MSNDTGLRQNLRANAATAARTLTSDAASDDPRTANGTIDILHRIGDGLETEQARRYVDSTIDQMRQESTHLNGQIRRRQGLPNESQEVCKLLHDAAAKLRAFRKEFETWKPTSSTEVMQAGLKTITTFVTSHPSVVPEIMNVLKPRELEYRTDEKKLRDTVKEARDEIAAARRRCETFDTDLAAREDELRLVRQQLEKKNEECASIAREKSSLERRLRAANAQIEAKDEQLQTLTRVAAENHDFQEDIWKLQAKVSEQGELIKKQPPLAEFEELQRSARRTVLETAPMSIFRNVLIPWSSMLAATPIDPREIKERKLNVRRLHDHWNLAVGWSQTVRLDWTRYVYRAVIHGLVITPATEVKDILSLAESLLIRLNTTPGSLSVALVEQLTNTLHTADETVVTRILGFVHTLARVKADEGQTSLVWSFPCRYSWSVVFQFLLPSYKTRKYAQCL